MLAFNHIGNLGRLGNQMFEYAALRGIAKKHGYDLVGEDIMNGPCTMEEWYVHESCNQDVRDKLRSKNCEAWELLLDL